MRPQSGYMKMVDKKCDKYGKQYKKILIFQAKAIWENLKHPSLMLV